MKNNTSVLDPVTSPAVGGGYLPSGEDPRLSPLPLPGTLGLPSKEEVGQNPAQSWATDTKQDDPDFQGTSSSTLGEEDQVSAKNSDPITGETTKSAKSSKSDPITGAGNGLKAEYFDGTELKLTRTDPTVDFNWGNGSPDKSIGSDNFSVRWTGQVQPEHSEKYTFHTTSDDGVRLTVNGERLIDNWSDHSAKQEQGSITLEGGKKYDIDLEYYENKGKAVEQLAWSSDSQDKQVIPQSQLFSEGGGEVVEPPPGTEPDPTPDPKQPSTGRSGKVLFSNGFEKGMEGFKAETKGDYSSEIVDSPARAGDKALKFTYNKSDADSGAKRSEMRMEPVPAGAERWYGVSFFVPKDFKDTKGSFILNQFHSRPDKGEEWNVPPLFLVANNGQLSLGNRWDARKITPKKDGKGQSWDLGPLPKDRWVDFVYHTKWSHKSDGMLEVFQDGEKVVSKNGPNSYNNKNGLFMKFGMYASGIRSKPEEYNFKQNEIYFDEIKMAGADGSYQDVTPQGASSAKP